MSEIVERTFASFLSSSLLGGGKTGLSKQLAPPRGLQALLQAVDSAQSRSEEEAVIQKELALLKQRLNQPGATPGQLRDLLPRIIFCSVIGYDVSFCCIHALKLAAAGLGMEKRAGYLAATLLLHCGEEITILMMGTLQKDLSSSNMVDNCLALTAAAYLVAAEHIPLMLPAVLKCLNHKRELVREKTVHCLHAFFLQAPSLMSHVLPQLCGMLKDKDPGVLSALVSVVISLAAEHLDTFLPLGRPLLSVLQQVRSRRFPPSHDYHGIPLPWLQMSLLKVLTVLASRDPNLMAAVFQTLSDILRDVNPRESISLAIAYQCIQTIAQLGKSVFKCGKNSNVDDEGQGVVSERMGDLSETRKCDAAGVVGSFTEDPIVKRSAGREPSAQQSWSEGCLHSEMLGDLQNQLKPLLHQASQCVASFLQSSVRNLRYVGVKSLAKLVAANPELAADHQTAVVQCLDDPDPAIRHQTLTLLHHMANPANVKVICSKLMEYMHQKGVDSNMQSDLVRMLCDLAGKFATDPQWYVDTLLPTLSLSLKPQVTSFIADCMLEYLIRASEQSTWLKYSKVLFLQMARAMQKGENESSVTTVQFALRVLKFVPMDCCDFDQVGLLSACQRILKTESLDVEIKELAVQCVQQLMMSGKLECFQVMEWLKPFTSQSQCSCQMQVSSMDKNSERTQAASFDLLPLAADQRRQLVFSFPRRLRRQLEELNALTKLQSKGQTLTLIDTPSTMDFTLSFTDVYISEVLEKGKPLLKKHIPKTKGVAAEAGFVQDMDEQSSITPPSGPSLSTSSPLEGTSRQDGTSVHTDQFTAGDSIGVSSTVSSLKNIPGVKQVWSKQGVAAKKEQNSAAQGENARINQTTGNMQDTEALSTKKQETEQEELARALFQGIPLKASPAISQSGPTSVTTPTQKETWEVPENVLPKGDKGGWRALHKTFNTEQVSAASDGASATSDQARNAGKTDTVADGAQNQHDLENRNRINASSVAESGLPWAETPVLPETGQRLQPIANQLSEIGPRFQPMTNQFSETGQQLQPRANLQSDLDDVTNSSAVSRDTNNSKNIFTQDAPSLQFEKIQSAEETTLNSAAGGNLYSEFLNADFSDLSDMEGEDEETSGKDPAHAVESEGRGKPIRGREEVKSDFYSEYVLSSSPLNPDGQF